MERVPLGKSNLLVSRMAVGCWTFGGGEYWGEQSPKDVDAVVQAALDLGVNFFDTAEVYNEGRSEEALGNALKGRRHEAVILTKQFIHPDVDDTVERCEAALKRLGTDYVDVLMIHWPVADEAVMERVFRRHEQLKRDGKVREVAVSNFGMGQMAMMERHNFHPCTNQLHYNIASRAADKEILPFCAEHRIGVMAYEALQQGVLTGRYRSLDEIPPRRARYRHYRVERCKGLHDHKGEGAEEELVALLDGMREISQETGLSMVDLSLGWLVRQKGITSAIVGCRNRNQLEQNVKGVETPIDDALNERLIRLSDPLYHKLGYFADYLKGPENPRVW